MKKFIVSFMFVLCAMPVFCMEKPDGISDELVVERQETNGLDAHEQEIVNNELIDAIKRGDLEDVKKAFLRGADIFNAGVVDSYDRKQPIHIACQEGHLDIVRWLVEQGVNVNSNTDESDWMPLYEACYYGHIDVVSWLCDHGADVHGVDYRGFGALNAAAQRGHFEMVKWLTEKYSMHEACQQLMHDAAEGGNIDLVRWLIENHKGNIKVEDEKGTEPIHYAAEGGHMGLIAWLVEQKIDINVCDSEGNQAIHYAVNGYVAEGKKLKSVKWLIDHGADVKACNHQSEQPIHKAAERGDIELVKLLVRLGADCNACDASSYRPIHRAVYSFILPESKKMEQVTFLVSRGADIDAISGQMERPLHVAAERGELELVKLLVRLGAHIDHVSLDNPIHRAAGLMATLGNGLGTVGWLIDQGVDCNVKNQLGYTPLHVARTLEVIECLVARGANMQAVDNNGYQPIRRAGHDVLKWLLLHGASPQGPSPEQLTVLEQNPLLKAVLAHDRKQIITLVRIAKLHEAQWNEAFPFLIAFSEVTLSELSGESIELLTTQTLEMAMNAAACHNKVDSFKMLHDLLFKSLKHAEFIAVLEKVLFWATVSDNSDIVFMIVDRTLIAGYENRLSFKRILKGIDDILFCNTTLAIERRIALNGIREMLGRLRLIRESGLLHSTMTVAELGQTSLALLPREVIRQHIARSFVLD